jgi:hypothetical protein
MASSRKRAREDPVSNKGLVHREDPPTKAARLSSPINFIEVCLRTNAVGHIFYCIVNYLEPVFHKSFHPNVLFFQGGAGVLAKFHVMEGSLFSAVLRRHKAMLRYLVLASLSHRWMEKPAHMKWPGHHQRLGEARYLLHHGMDRQQNTILFR